MIETIVLRAGALSAGISRFGAELTSLRHSAIGEFMWQATDDRWPRQAPLLFPVIGRYPADLVLLGEGKLSLPLHGFAPDSLFEVVRRDMSACSLVLADDAQTRAVYPYAFRLQVDFILTADSLDMTITVHNPAGQVTLPFMLGGHPGFAWPLPDAGAADEHRCWFTRREDSPMRVVSERPDAEVCRHVFDGWLADPSAMEFRGITHVLSPVHSDSVTFGTERVHMTLGFEGFDTLAIWRRDTAPFLCLEPWTSLPINVGVPTQFADLPELVRLDPGASQRFAMRFAPGGRAIRDYNAGRQGWF